MSRAAVHARGDGLVDVEPRVAVSVREPAIFASLVVAQLVPLLVFGHFPGWDGPAHVGAAAVIAHYRDPAYAAFREYFVVRAFPSPNVAGHLLLVALVPFVRAAVADKIVVATILVAIPCALRFAVGAIDPRARYLGYLGLPLALGWFVHAGQYNFCLGFAAFLATVGAWLRARPGPARAATFGALLVACYLCHIVALGGALLFVGALAAAEARDAGAATWLGRHALALVLAVAPVGLLVAAYALHTGSGPTARLPLAKLVVGLATLAPAIVVFAWREAGVGVAVVGAIVAVAARALRGARVGKGSRDAALLGLVAVSVVLYFVVPDSMAGGSFLSARLALLPYVALLLWAAGRDPGPAWRRAVVGVGVAGSLVLVALRMPAYAAFDRDLREYLSFAPELPRNATVLPLFFKTERTPGGGSAVSARTRPLDTAAGYLMADRGVVDLSHYESAFGYFPTGFRPPLDPYVHLATHPDWQQVLPPAVDIGRYERETAGRVDYVLVWGMRVAEPVIRDDPATAAIRAELDAHYRLVHESSPRALLQVYKRRE